MHCCTVQLGNAYAVADLLQGSVFICRELMFVVSLRDKASQGKSYQLNTSVINAICASGMS